MELRDYLQILSKRIWSIIVVVILVTATAAFFAYRQKETYEGSLTLTINKERPAAQKDASYYQYDNYYLLQSNSIFADELASWLTQPENIVKAYQSAGLSIPTGGIKDYSKLIKAKKPQINIPLISVSASGGNKEELSSLLDGIKDNATSRINDVNKTTDGKFVLEANTPEVLTIVPDPTGKVITGLIAGLILGIVVAFGREYFAKK